MNITIHGVRGSIPTTTLETKKYGGNTSCVEVEADGWRLVLDAGSGMQHIHAGNGFRNNRVDILLTHLHIDHIQGLGFFKPLFNPESEIHIWGPASKTQSLRARLGRYFSPPLFPVYFRNLTCKLVLHEVDDSSFAIGPFHIESCHIMHPGPTLGFRVRHQRGTLAYLPDHEPALGRDGLLHDVKWLSGSDLAKEADLLLHDAQYTPEEYKDRVGWGHSSLTDALEYAALTGVKKLLLTHHDPLRSDEELEKAFRHLQETTSYQFPYALAYEGLAIQL
ncbi:MBL fold metallo-hydrolase [Flavisolibacter nicotianae]|uniref:MBL fold metallo-hydrolase n=1 Tax=Flavisolibacter nicotianae TaxID=2364882 RepID=UPI000EB4A440|nr:MBL fold metallo-hydrolase [Flavisolibacter nicotianae]